MVFCVFRAPLLYVYSVIIFPAWFFFSLRSYFFFFLRLFSPGKFIQTRVSKIYLDLSKFSPQLVFVNEILLAPITLLAWHASCSFFML